MEQMKAYKFRIYPSEIQKQLIEKSFGCARFVYNHMLALQIKTYEEQGKSYSKYDLVKMIPSLKKEYEWLKEVDSTCLQSTIDDLDNLKAYLLSLDWSPTEWKLRDLTKDSKKKKLTPEKLLDTIKRYVDNTINGP